jgi:uncharacterized membrane protein YciS (DUF1049 family)
MWVGVSVCVSVCVCVCLCVSVCVCVRQKLIRFTWLLVQEYFFTSTKVQILTQVGEGWASPLIYSSVYSNVKPNIGCLGPYSLLYMYVIYIRYICIP